LIKEFGGIFDMTPWRISKQNPGTSQKRETCAKDYNTFLCVSINIPVWMSCQFYSILLCYILNVYTIL